MTHTLITGGSSGIGLAVASILLKRGQCVSIVARDIDRLRRASDSLRSEGAKKENFVVQSADVANFGELKAAIDSATRNFGPVDKLIASAGIVQPAMFLDQSADDFNRQIATNLIGVANVVRAVLPGMTERRQGRIGIISSGAGLIGIPGYAGYCASKFGLKGFAEALRLETRADGISVTICFPPDTDTPQYREEMQARPKEAVLFLGCPMPRSTTEIAENILNGMERERKCVYFRGDVAALDLFGWIIKPFLHRSYFKRLNKCGHR